MPADDERFDPTVEDERAYLRSLRPSRIREVQAGRPAWTHAHVVQFEGGCGGAVRAALETMGIRVMLTAVGQARHLVRALAEEESAPYVVLACHGDEGRILLPPLAEEIERFQPFHRSVGSHELRSFARFRESVVISTGCDTGSPELAGAFLSCGASAYIAPQGAPFGYASFFAPVFLFYELTEGRSLRDAIDRLRAHDRELSMWRLFEGTGEES